LPFPPPPPPPAFLLRFANFLPRLEPSLPKQKTTSKTSVFSPPPQSRCHRAALFFRTNLRQRLQTPYTLAMFFFPTCTPSVTPDLFPQATPPFLLFLSPPEPLPLYSPLTSPCLPIPSSRAFPSLQSPTFFKAQLYFPPSFSNQAPLLHSVPSNFWQVALNSPPTRAFWRLLCVFTLQKKVLPPFLSGFPTRPYFSPPPPEVPLPPCHDLKACFTKSSLVPPSFYSPPPNPSFFLFWPIGEPSLDLPRYSTPLPKIPLLTPNSFPILNPSPLVRVQFFLTFCTPPLRRFCHFFPPHPLFSLFAKTRYASPPPSISRLSREWSLFRTPLPPHLSSRLRPFVPGPGPPAMR